MAPGTKWQNSSDDYQDIGIRLDDASGEAGAETAENKPVETASANPDRFKISPKPPSERRVWKRYAIDGAVVMAAKPSLLSTLKPSYVKIGPIKDIGMKGMAVHYVETSEAAIRKTDHLSIMFPGSRTIVERIPFKIVNQFRAAVLPGGKEVWNLCIAFGRLNPLQRIQIEAFIDDYGNELKSR